MIYVKREGSGFCCCCSSTHISVDMALRCSEDYRGVRLLGYLGYMGMGKGDDMGLLSAVGVGAVIGWI